MSYALEPLKVVQTLDPVIDIAEPRSFNILKGGSENTCVDVSANSYSSSQIQFNVPPPSANTIVDRKIFLSVPVRVVQVCTNQAPQLCYQSGFGAFRRLPLSSVIDTITLKINGQQRTANIAQYIDALAKYNGDDKLFEHELSGSPAFPDQSQQYSDLVGFARNPLSSYGDAMGMDVQHRGAFPMTLVANTTTGCTIDAVLTEPLFISPLLFGTDMNSAGLVGVRDMVVQINFRSNLGYMWSQVSGVAGSPVITAHTVSLNGVPQLSFRYVSPQLTQTIPSLREYGLLDINPITLNMGALGAGNTVQQTSQNITLQTIPRRMYIYAKRQQADQTHFTTDSYAAINSISITWNNRNGIGAGMSQFDLYYRWAKKNGCSSSFTDWSAQPTQFVSGATTKVIRGSGSVLCIEFGTDIALAPDEAAGVSSGANYSLQYTVSLTNPSAASINYELYTVFVSEGTFSVVNNQTAISQIGVVSRADVLDSKDAPQVMYEDLHTMAGSGSGGMGGDFRSTLSKVLRGLHRGASKALPYVKSGVSMAEKGLPAFEKALDTVGLGVVGGQLVSGKSMARRLKH